MQSQGRAASSAQGAATGAAAIHRARATRPAVSKGQMKRPAVPRYRRMRGKMQDTALELPKALQSERLCGALARFLRYVIRHLRHDATLDVL